MLDFVLSDFLSLGVEVEVQLLDRHTLDLVPAAPQVLAALADKTVYRPEFFSTMLEMCTGVCRDLSQVETDLSSASARLLRVADEAGLVIAGNGTHAFAGLSDDSLLYPNPRYRELLYKNQWIGRNKNLYGLHVHVGTRSCNQAVRLINGVTPYLAYLLALSASSPFWHGQDSGLASARATVFESQPTSGSAPYLRDYTDYQQLIGRLLRAKAIQSLKDLHWDIRPCPYFGTVEVRICDGQANLADTLAVVAVVQSLFSWLDEQPAGPQPSPWRLRENKWRAIRWGLDAEVLVDDEGHLRPLRQELARLMVQIEPHAQRLGCAHHLRHALQMLYFGNSCSRQRLFYRRKANLIDLTRALADEWRTHRSVVKNSNQYTSTATVG